MGKRASQQYSEDLTDIQGQMDPLIYNSDSIYNKLPFVRDLNLFKIHVQSPIKVDLARTGVHI